MRHEAQVVDGRQPQKKAVVDFEKMVQIGYRVAAATEAIAPGRDGDVLLNDFVVIDIEVLKPLLAGAGRGDGRLVDHHVEMTPRHLEVILLTLQGCRKEEIGITSSGLKP